MSNGSPRPLSVGLFGTFDVDNYGDCLFPVILGHVLREHLPELNVVRFSPRSGVSPFDGLPIHSLAELHDLGEGLHAFIVGGGDIIRFDPPHPYDTSEGDLPPYPALWILPALHGTLQGKPVLWNAPGVPHPFTEDQAEVVNAVLRLAAYITVRDDESRQRLPHGIPDVHVVPDAAFLLADIFPRTGLTSTYQAAAQRLSLQAPYAVVQVSGAGVPHLESAAGALRQMADRFGLSILLLPLDPVHGDADALAALAVRGRFAPVPQGLHPLESLALIAHGRLFVGTSLHGNITAFAYGVPSVAVNPMGLAKLADWGRLTTRRVVGSWDDLAPVLRDALTDAAPVSKEDTIRERLRSEVEEHRR